MASFREAFTRDQKETLEYDDGAALFFGGTLLLCVLLPWTVLLVQRLRAPVSRRQLLPPLPGCSRWVTTTSTVGEDDSAEPGPGATGLDESTTSNGWIERGARKGPRYVYCTCSECMSHHTKQQQDQASLRVRLVSTGFLLEIGALFLLWTAFAFLVRSASQVSTLQSFNPFEILNIPDNSDFKSVRRAYRNLSLRHHPDRNPNDPTAAARFIMIAKAYEALTDEVARANFEKYGNPDGPGVMKIGIGLPRFLVAAEYQNLVLVLFVLIAILLVPLLFILHYQRQRNYYPNGVRVETVHLMSYCLHEEFRMRDTIELLAATAEARLWSSTSSSPEDNKLFDLLEAAVDDSKRGHLNIPSVKRSRLLLLGHLQRLHHLFSPSMKRQLDELLKSSLPVTRSMMEMVFVHDWQATLSSVVSLRRSLVQALDYTSNKSTVLMLPNFDDAAAAIAGLDSIDSVEAMVALPQDKRADLIAKVVEAWGDQNPIAATDLKKMATKESHLEPPDRRRVDQVSDDVSKFCRAYPRVSITATIETAGENEIVEQDVITATVTLTRNHLKPWEFAGPLHAPKFPLLLYDHWWIFIADRRSGQLKTYARCEDLGSQASVSLRFLAPKPGNCVFRITAVSDFLFGCDTVCDIPLKIHCSKEVQRPIFVHPDDAALDQAVPSLVEQLTGGGVFGDIESSESENSDDNDTVE